MTGGPLADVLAVVMIAVTCFHAGRLTLAKLWRRSTQVDVDIVHTAMGVSMAGMLTGWVTGAWNDVWIVAFAASTVWFGRSLVRRLPDTRATGLAVAHHLPHFVASAVMLYMLWAMRWMSMSGGKMGQMGATGAIGSVGHAVGGSLFLPSIVAALVVGNAAIAAWMALSPPLGAVVPADVVAARVTSPVMAPGAAAPRQVRMLGARGAPACLVAMSVGMAYMVVAVHP